MAKAKRAGINQTADIGRISGRLLRIKAALGTLAKDRQAARMLEFSKKARIDDKIAALEAERDELQASLKTMINEATAAVKAGEDATLA